MTRIQSAHITVTDMRAVVVGNIPMSAAITAGINTVITAKETASAGEGSSADAVFKG